MRFLKIPDRCASAKSGRVKHGNERNGHRDQLTGHRRERVRRDKRVDVARRARDFGHGLSPIVPLCVGKFIELVKATSDIAYRWGRREAQASFSLDLAKVSTRRKSDISVAFASANRAAGSPNNGASFSLSDSTRNLTYSSPIGRAASSADGHGKIGVLN